MNTKIEFVAAIDIGTTKIVAVAGKRNANNKLEILGMSKTVSKGVKRGVVLNIEETVNAIQTVVTELQQKTGIKLTNTFVGIAGQHIKNLKNRGYINRDSYDDEITKADVKRLIDDARKIPIDIGEEIIHVLPQSFVVDNETGIKNPIGMSGKRLEANFQIVVGQISSIKNIEKCVNRVGLGIYDVILEPLASAAAVLTDDEKEAGVILVDIGGGTTDMAIYHDGIIRHTAVIPFGGNVITRDIKEGCSILERHAEELKIKFGSALGDLAEDNKSVVIPGISGRDSKEISFKNLAYIIQSRMEEIINIVMFEIENSEFADKLSAGIVITGGGALLRNLPQLVRFHTGMDVRIGYPNAHLASNANDDINQPMYATSIGLILKGFESLEANNHENVKANFMEVKTESVPTIEPEIVQKTTEETENKSKPSIFDSWINALQGIFDDNGSKM